MFRIKSIKIKNLGVIIEVIWYTLFHICTIVWDGIETCELAASLHTKICRSVIRE